MIIREASKYEIWFQWVTAHRNSFWWDLPTPAPLFFQLINCHVWQVGRQHIITKLSRSHSRPKYIIAISPAWRQFETNSFSLTLISLNIAHIAQIIEHLKLVYYLILLHISTEMTQVEFLYEKICLNMFCQKVESGRK